MNFDIPSSAEIARSSIKHFLSTLLKLIAVIYFSMHELKHAFLLLTVVHKGPLLQLYRTAVGLWGLNLDSLSFKCFCLNVIKPQFATFSRTFPELPKIFCLIFSSLFVERELENTFKTHFIFDVQCFVLTKCLTFMLCFLTYNLFYTTTRCLSSIVSSCCLLRVSFKLFQQLAWIDVLIIDSFALIFELWSSPNKCCSM